MINLLPPVEKQNLVVAKQQKIIVILGFLILIFLICLALVSFWVNFSLASQVAAQKIFLTNKQQSFEATDVKGWQEKVAKINQDLTRLDSFYQQKPSLTVFLENLSNTLVEGISLDSISVNPIKKETNLFQIYLSGYASSVDAVINFDKNLKENKDISQISFPSDTWLGKQNFIFSVIFQAVIKK
jgi:Tfp pilus assembly protein PilN